MLNWVRSPGKELEKEVPPRVLYPLNPQSAHNTTCLGWYPGVPSTCQAAALHGSLRQYSFKEKCFKVDEQALECEDVDLYRFVLPLRGIGPCPKNDDKAFQREDDHLRSVSRRQVDQVVMHFSRDGLILLKDSPEAQDQMEAEGKLKAYPRIL